MNFTELNLDDQILEAISYMGFENATPIQEQVIPLILENRDVIACAQTGTGKTAAYVLPILDKLVDKDQHGVDTLIIVPTRELAIQIEQQIQGFAYFVSAGCMAIYGGGDGNDWESQKQALLQGTDIIVATPGKLLSYMRMGDLNFNKLKHLILDEADRMLDMGFIPDIQKIISYLPKHRQTLMFSATMPPSIRQLARKILHNPAEISLALSKPAESIDQKAFAVYDTQKTAVLKYLLEQRPEYDSILLFTSSKSRIFEIVNALHKGGFQAQGISSDLSQEKREEVLGKYKARRIRILVATDVVSRGIDVKEINLVINFDVPHDAEDYVHRVGRTARINASGEAVTLVTPKDMEKFARIERLIGSVVPRPELPAELGPFPSWELPERKPKEKRNFRRRKK
jgi:superfamily II DNA/RNA helicase